MKKINQQMLILQSIGIILVVVGHKGGISLLTEWFPVNSFHMPMFMFISGYFYQVKSEIEFKGFVIKKVKHLLVPYFIWNFIYGIIITLLRYIGLAEFGSSLTLRSLFIEPWIGGHQFGLNVAAWFVLALFIVQVIYVLIRKSVVRLNLNNEYLMGIVLLVVGCIGITLANKGYNTRWYLTLVRTMFFIPFYHFGYLYRTKFEEKDTLNSGVYFLAIFIIQFILISKYLDISFTAVWCSGFNKDNILLPYITSATGIMFWLRVSKILVKSIGESSVVKMIGTNTWSIMMHHQFVFYVINVIFAAVYVKFGLEWFEIDQFKSNMWYAYAYKDGRFKLFYVILGVWMPILIKQYINIIRVKIKNKKVEKNENALN